MRTRVLRPLCSCFPDPPANGHGLCRCFVDTPLQSTTRDANQAALLPSCKAACLDSVDSDTSDNLVPSFNPTSFSSTSRVHPRLRPKQPTSPPSGLRSEERRVGKDGE